jgi:hypothetical protein
MADKPLRLFGPLAMLGPALYTTNIYNQSDALLYDLCYSFHIVNKTVGIVTFRIFLGATGANAAGTELYYDYPVQPNSYVDLPFYGGLKLTSADFLVGGANTTLALTITAFGKRAVL